MKKTIGVLLLFFLSWRASSQVVVALLFGDKLNTGKMTFGIVLAESFTNITNIVSKTKPGLNLGLYFDIRPDKKFYLHIEGIAKGTFGAKGIPPYPTGNDSLDALLVNGSITRKIQGFSMPVLVRYKFTKLFAAEAGIQPNMRLKANDI